MSIFQNRNHQDEEWKLNKVSLILQHSDFKNAIGADTSSFAKKTDLANLKSNVNELDIDKSKNVPNNLSNFKSNVDKLDADTWNEENEVIEKDVYNAKIKNKEEKIPDITISAANASLKC